MIRVTLQELTYEKIEARRGFAEVSIGEKEIVSKYNYILHQIRPDSIENCLVTAKNNTILIKDEVYRGMIESEIEETESMLHTLRQNRVKRGAIDAGGRLLNWAFGTLDDNDKKEIEKHFISLEESNDLTVGAINQQIEINKGFNESFNK